MMHYNTQNRTNSGFIQAGLIIALMTMLLIFASYQILGRFGLFLVAAFAVGGIIALARSKPENILKSANLIRYQQAPEVYDMLRKLSISAGLENVPRLYYIPSPLMNAMTVGRKDDPSIIVTGGLLDRLTWDELEGVIAHEISHVKNDDLSLFGISEILRRLTAFVARTGWIILILFFPFMFFSSFPFSFGGFLLMIGAPVVSLLFQLALMRAREYRADADAVRLTGDPQSLSRALRKLTRQQFSFLSILFPVPKRQDHSLFRSHPDAEERIRRLKNMARQEG